MKKMRIHPTAFVATAMLMSACAAVPVAETEGPVPDVVLSMAGPGQDLSTVILREEDNCYWYEHTSPVETTILPLRDASGRPICASV
ncbi:hypothetical protein [Yoonia litorea]|uniref:Lipoprotein n=1 Tax=Yoonia litorea TaxID=1123755 RepID=A0A1I6N041_9RHOB|nr:hypothetical protein [Yoonia litorea]SFS21294.1 hypothetical protein SAMN05444714_2792 [Yoonia litorea]